MKTKTIEIYSIDELSEDLQQTAYQNWLEKGYGQNSWTSENRDSLNKFLEIFPSEISRSGFLQFTESEHLESLTGVRLSTYLWNNYGKQLYKGKCFGTLSSAPNKTVHPRIKNEWLKEVERYFKPYHSAIILERSCVLTGYWMDDEILQPIYEFMREPNERTDFKQLLYECFQAYERACEMDAEHAQSFEAFMEDARANEMEFLENGDFA